MFHQRYNPIWDPQLNVYQDKCPYQLQDSKYLKYKCGCSFTASFDSPETFYQHIRTDNHQQYLKKYHYVLALETDLETQNQLLLTQLTQIHFELQDIEDHLLLTDNPLLLDKVQDLLRSVSSKL